VNCTSFDGEEADALVLDDASRRLAVVLPVAASNPKENNEREPLRCVSCCVVRVCACAVVWTTNLQSLLTGLLRHEIQRWVPMKGTAESASPLKTSTFQLVSVANFL
jgi:hypothetical protein